MARERPPFQGFTPERREQLVTLLSGKGEAHRERATAAVQALESRFRPLNAMEPLADSRAARARLRRGLSATIAALGSPLIEGDGLGHDLRVGLLVLLGRFRTAAGLMPTKGGRPRNPVSTERQQVERAFLGALSANGLRTGSRGVARALVIVVNDVVQPARKLKEHAAARDAASAAKALTRAKQRMRAFQQGLRAWLARKRQAEAAKIERQARALRRLLHGTPPLSDAEFILRALGAPPQDDPMAAILLAGTGLHAPADVAPRAPAVATNEEKKV